MAQIAEQAEEIGRLKAELAASSQPAEATSTNGQTQEGAAPDPPERRRWWRWLWG